MPYTTPNQMFYQNLKYQRQFQVQQQQKMYQQCMMQQQQKANSLLSMVRNTQQGMEHFVQPNTYASNYTQPELDIYAKQVLPSNGAGTYSQYYLKPVVLPDVPDYYGDSNSYPPLTVTQQWYENEDECQKDDQNFVAPYPSKTIVQKVCSSLQSYENDVVSDDLENSQLVQKSQVIELENNQLQEELIQNSNQFEQHQQQPFEFEQQQQMIYSPSQQGKRRRHHRHRREMQQYPVGQEDILEEVRDFVETFPDFSQKQKTVTFADAQNQLKSQRTSQRKPKAGNRMTIYEYQAMILRKQKDKTQMSDPPQIAGTQDLAYASLKAEEEEYNLKESGVSQISEIQKAEEKIE